MKTIGVGLATYNGEYFIKEQVDSILDQTLNPDEIVIVDDCSSDCTYEILKSYSSKYDFIKLYKNKENLGFARNFQKVLSLCESDYVALSDQDDKWLPNKLEACMQTLQKGNSTTNKICYHDAILMYEDGRYLKNTTFHNLSHYKYPLSQEDALQYLLRFTVPVLGFMMFFDSYLVKKYINFFPIGKWATHDWFLCILYYSFFSPVFIEEPLACYRLHSRQASGAIDYLLENTKYDIKKKPTRQRIAAEWKRFIDRANIKKRKKIEQTERSAERILALESLSQIVKDMDEDYVDVSKKQKLLDSLKITIDELSC